MVGLDDDGINAKLETGWRCGHWPALLEYNDNRPQSLDRRPRTRKVSKASSASLFKAPKPSVEPPFTQNLYDLYHPDNTNRIRCCSTKAFRYWILPCLKPGRLENDQELVARRIKLILDCLVLGRNLYSETIDENGKPVKINDELPEVSIETQELRLSADELAEYEAREKQARQDVARRLNRGNA